MNKALLYLLARTGLIDQEEVDKALEGQQLLRAACPVHEGADNPTAFVLNTDRWFCNTRECHSTYGGRLEGLVVALADRYGREDLRDGSQGAMPPFRDARAWLKRNAGRLREVFRDWPTAKEGGRTRSGGGNHTFSCSRSDVLASLTIPSWYFLQRGFAADTLRRYDIGEARSRHPGVFRGLANRAVVPLYDLGESGRCVGYVARAISDWEKVRWKFCARFPNGQRLFNYPAAREANRQAGQVILVEGVGDALRCVEAGFPQVVAALGSDLYDEQVERLAQMRLNDVVVVRDNDDAGAKFARQVRDRLSALALAVRVVQPPSQVKDIGAMRTEEAREFLAATVGSPEQAGAA
jgi:5S rRNA maturation endonuclease (ribonuclease M5)